MDKKKLLLLAGALVIAIGTALAARSMFAGASAPQAVAAAPEPPASCASQTVTSSRGAALAFIAPDAG